MKNIIEILEARGLKDHCTTEQIKEFAEKEMTLYIGFDPTADSLHLGNLVGIVVLGWFQQLGHKPIALVGGATGMIGDPSGKSVERNLLDEATIAENLKGIRCSLESVLRTDITICNNFDWFKGFSYIDFLREIGKHFRMGTLLAKDSVRSRLNSEEGLSYTEFSYQMLQAYDFLHLFDTKGVTLQMGGSDQWGNIVAGTELVRKMRGKTVHGMTYPLLTRADGKKFGKSEEGAIWLNEDKMSAYDFYQHLYRVADEDVIKLLKMITFLELSEIAEIEQEMKRSSYVANSAQKILAQSVTELVRGKEAVKAAEAITEAARPGAKTTLDYQTLEQLAKEIPNKQFAKEEVVGQKIADLLALSGLLQSKGEARRMIKNGGIYLNNEKVIDVEQMIEKQDLIAEKFLLLSIGKKNKVVVQIEREK